MTTKFAPAPQAPAPAEKPRARSRGRVVGTVILAVLAIVSAVLAVGFAYAVAEEYGVATAPANIDLLPLLVLAVIPGVLLGTSVTMIAGLYGRKAPIWATIPVAFVLMWAATGVLSNAGAEQHARNDVIIAGACTPEETAVLNTFRTFGSEYSGAAGQKTGECTAWIMMPGEDADAAMTAVADRLTTEGWVRRVGDLRSAMWVKGYDAVQVDYGQSSEGTTGVGLTMVSTG